MTKRTWHCIYRGKPDDLSSRGVAAPSWHTFDCRTWVSDPYTMTLKRLRSHTYEVTIVKGEATVATFNGKSHIALCKQARQWVADSDG